MIPHATMPLIAFALFTPMACAQTWQIDEGFVTGEARRGAGQNLRSRTRRSSHGQTGQNNPPLPSNLR